MENEKWVLGNEPWKITGFLSVLQVIYEEGPGFLKMNLKKEKTKIKYIHTKIVVVVICCASIGDVNFLLCAFFF